MARINLKPRTKPKTVTRLPKHFDEKYIGAEPEWVEGMAEEKIHKEIFRGYYYYNYFYTVKEMRVHLLEYGTSVLNWSPLQQKQFKAADDNQVRLVDCSTARMLLTGLVFPTTEAWEGAYNRFLTRVNLYLEQPVDEDEVSPGKGATIQQKMADKFRDLVADIDDWYDLVVNEKYEQIDNVKWLRDQTVSQQHATQLSAYYSSFYEELKEARSKSADKDLKEAYAHLTKKQYQDRLKWYESLLDALRTYGQVKSKTRKSRKPKAISKEKLVAKVQYKKEDTELNIVSSNPIDIVGAKTVWVYNAKTRKIGAYHADSSTQVLGIKGTTLIGFDPKTSLAKTLRKPKEQLAQFNNSGKIALRTFIDDIKATPVTMNGRFSTDIVILKIIK